MLASRRHPVSIPVLLRAQSLFASGASVQEVYAALGSGIAETHAQSPAGGDFEALLARPSPAPDDTATAVLLRIEARIDALEAALTARPDEAAPADLARRMEARFALLEAAVESAPAEMAARIASRIDALDASIAARAREITDAELAQRMEVRFALVEAAVESAPVELSKRIGARIDVLERRLAARGGETMPADPAPRTEPRIDDTTLAGLAERIEARIDALEATLAARPGDTTSDDLAERIASRIDALEAVLATRPGDTAPADLAARIDALAAGAAALPRQAADAVAVALVGRGGGLAGDEAEWSATDALAAVVALRMLQIVERQLSRLDALAEPRPEAPASTGHRLIARLRGRKSAEPANEAPPSPPETLDRNEIVRQMEDTLAHINDLLGRGVNR